MIDGGLEGLRFGVWGSVFSGFGPLINQDVLDLSIGYRKLRQPRKLLPRLGPVLRVCAYRRR